MESSTLIDITSIKTAIEAIVSAQDEQQIKTALQDFLHKASPLYKFDDFNSDGSLPPVWDKLFQCMSSNHSTELQLLALDALLILTRNREHYQYVLTRDRVNILLQFAHILNVGDVHDNDYRTVAALKCLYNIVYNSQAGLQVFIDQNCVDKILHRAEDSDSKLMSQIKLFDMKVLFLVSALCKDVREDMKEKHGIKHLIKKFKYVQDSTSSTLSTPEADVFCEILKILFNLSLNITDDQEDQDSCLELVQVLRRLLVMTVLNDQTKIELHSNIVNLLTNMSYSSYSALIIEVGLFEHLEDLYKFENYNMKAVYHLLEFLEVRLSSSNKVEDLAPILTALLRSASSTRCVRKYLRLNILPPLHDVHSRPEEGSTLRNKLCRLLTNPTPQVSDLTASLLFVLCKENVGRMVKHTGYGNAAGLLAQRGLLAGSSNSTTVYNSDSEDSDTEEYRQHRNRINPVVGCYETPHPNPTDTMTEEQKEYEAMQLVNLMDNLARKGFVKPCKVGEDGTLQPVEHILELQDALPAQQVRITKKN